MDIECRGVDGYFDDELSIVACHGGVVVVAECAEHDTSKGSLGGCIDADTPDLLGGIGGYDNTRYFFLCRRFFACCVIVLCNGRCGDDYKI